MSDSKNQDDVDDEITAVFAEGEPGEDGMSKSWHGSRSARCGTLLIQPFWTFFVSVKRASVSLSTSAGLRVQDLHLL